MSSAVILQHSAHVGPGRIVPVFRDFGIPVHVRRLDRGDDVPANLDEIRFLVVLGGDMSFADLGSGRFPFYQAEVDALKQFVAQDRPVLGINLGAQLLAFAAGAKVYPNARPGPTPDDPGTPVPEFGWGPITLPFPGGAEPMMMGLANGSMMLHWHAETFDLPKLPPPPPPPADKPPGPPPPTGNALLASSAKCRNQAFRFKNRLFGFQFHFEQDEAGIEAIVNNPSEAAKAALGSDGLGQVKAAVSEHYSRYARLGDRLLRNYVQFLKVYA